MGAGRRGPLVLVLVLVLLPGCEAQEGGWTPVLEADVPRFLATELERVREDVAEARRELAPEAAADAAAGPVDSLGRLEDAERRLSALTEVYLPLYGANVAASNAYRRHQLGQEREVAGDLDRIDEVVSSLSRSVAGGLESELEQISARVARARTALEGGSPETAGRLRDLAEMLNDLVTRAGLIL